MNNFWSKARSNKQFVICFVLVILLILLAGMADFIVLHDPYKEDYYNMLAAPGNGFLCGTDAIGRCVFCRILSGAKYSLLYTFSMVMITTFIGSVIGFIAGYFGTWVDELLMLFTDIMIGIPTQVCAIAIIAVMGPGIMNLILAAAVLWWTNCARMVRNKVRIIKTSAYIEEAILGGENSFRIIVFYILPNAFQDILILAMLDVGKMMLALAGYSFLGLAAQPPQPEWGYMLSEGRLYIQNAPWMLVYPGIAIFITVVLFNLFGDAIRDLLDPKMKAKSRKNKCQQKEEGKK